MSTALLLSVVLSSIVTGAVTNALLQSNDRVMGWLRRWTSWNGPGPEPTSRFAGRAGIALGALAVWLVLVLGVYAGLLGLRS